MLERREPLHVLILAGRLILLVVFVQYVSNLISGVEYDDGISPRTPYRDGELSSFPRPQYRRS